jgi:cleavage stimulation factor subunit 3
MATGYDPTNQGDAWDEDEGYGVADGFHRSAITQHSSVEDQPHFSYDQAHRAPGDVPSDDAASDMGDYDPDTVTSTLAPTSYTAEPTVAKPSPNPTAKKPKTAGGFIVDSDSEDDDTPAPGDSGMAVAASSYQANPHTTSPLQTSVTLPRGAAPASSKQDHAAQQSKSPATAPSNGHGQASAAPVPAVNAQQKAPQDRIAILEERVREDPRGAMDAWTALMREYRERSKIEDARRTYNSFLTVFPQAVSILFSLETWIWSLTISRRIFGLII